MTEKFEKKYSFFRTCHTYMSTSQRQRFRKQRVFRGIDREKKKTIYCASKYTLLIKIQTSRQSDNRHASKEFYSY